ncbi:hypothetical protein Tco_1142308 [Tanacetum coccineum]
MTMEMKVEEEIIEAEKKLSLIDLLFVTMVAHSKVCRLVTIPFARKNEGLKRGLQSVDSSDYPMIESGRSSSSSKVSVQVTGYMCECLATIMSPDASIDNSPVLSQGGRRSLTSLAQRIMANFCARVRSNKCFFDESSNYKQEGGWITSVEIKPITKSIVRWNNNHKVDGRNPVNYSYGILLLEAITGRNPVIADYFCAPYSSADSMLLVLQLFVHDK